MTTIVSVARRLYSSHVHYGDDALYRDELTSILREVEAIAGAVISGADYPVFAQGCHWQFMLGVPRDGQEHYIEFDQEADAVFYMLKYGGEIVQELDEVELAWAK